MSEHTIHQPTAMKGPYFTPGVIVLTLLAMLGLGVLAWRLVFGLGSVTNLNDQYPWGLWNVFKVCGVALSAGGFTTAALAHVMHRPIYHVFVVSLQFEFQFFLTREIWLQFCLIDRDV